MMYKMCHNDTRNAKYDRSHESLAREQVKVGGETKNNWHGLIAGGGIK